MSDIITLTEAKSFLGISGSDDDFILQLAVSSASDAVIQALNGDPRSFAATETYNGTGSEKLGVNRSPITAVTSISIYAGDFPYISNPSTPIVVDLSNVYWTDYAVYWRAGKFTRGVKNVVINYTAGVDPTPNPIKMAALYTMKAMWNARFVDPNATSESYSGVMSQGFWSSGPGAVPPSAISLLNPYMNRFKVM